LVATEALTDVVARDSKVHTVGTGQTIENASVMARVQQIETADALAKATRLYGSGDTESAVRVVDSQLTSNSKYLERGGSDPSSFERVNKHLEGLKKKMSSTSRHSSDGNFITKFNKAYANDVVQSSVV